VTKASEVFKVTTLESYAIGKPQSARHQECNEQQVRGSIIALCAHTERAEHDGVRVIG
jgi:hypothetical protein